MNRFSLRHSEATSVIGNRTFVLKVRFEGQTNPSGGLVYPVRIFRPRRDLLAAGAKAWNGRAITDRPLRRPRPFPATEQPQTVSRRPAYAAETRPCDGSASGAPRSTNGRVRTGPSAEGGPRRREGSGSPQAKRCDRTATSAHAKGRTLRLRSRRRRCGLRFDGRRQASEPHRRRSDARGAERPENFSRRNSDFSAEMSYICRSAAEMRKMWKDLTDCKPQ